MEYAPKDILNADETRLFYHALPNKTMYLKNRKCHGGKVCKEQLAVLLCTSMTGVKEPTFDNQKVSKALMF